MKRFLVVAAAVLSLALLLDPSLALSDVGILRNEPTADRFPIGARAQAMGGAFAAVADDGSAILINPAGIVSTRWTNGYFEYGGKTSEVASQRWAAALRAPAAGMSFGLGYFGWNDLAGSTGDRFLLAAARTLVEGTPGSYLAVGAALGGMFLVNGAHSPFVTGDVGVILKPLPVISFGYSARNVTGGGIGDIERAYPRLQRWGIAYFWENAVTLSFEARHSGQETDLHYGLSVKTALPLELMAGFSDGSASGGLRWAGSRIKAIVSFAADGKGAVTGTAACEIALYRGRPREGQ